MLDFAMFEAVAFVYYYGQFYEQYSLILVQKKPPRIGGLAKEGYESDTLPRTIIPKESHKINSSRIQSMKISD